MQACMALAHSCPLGAFLVCIAHNWEEGGLRNALGGGRFRALHHENVPHDASAMQACMALAHTCLSGSFLVCIAHNWEEGGLCNPLGGGRFWALLHERFFTLAQLVWRALHGDVSRTRLDVGRWLALLRQKSPTCAHAVGRDQRRRFDECSGRSKGYI